MTHSHLPTVGTSICLVLRRKTIQTAAYVNIVARQLPTRGPFLVIVPLSTVHNWQREFTTWTDLNTVVYHGEPKDRELTRFYEFPFPDDRVEIGSNARSKLYLNRVQKQWRYNWEKSWMVEVVITTPEIFKADSKELAAIDWEILIVDEAHCLKNRKSQLARNLRDVKFKHSLLLTGTPIQVSFLLHIHIHQSCRLELSLDKTTAQIYYLEQHGGVMESAQLR